MNAIIIAELDKPTIIALLVGLLVVLVVLPRMMRRKSADSSPALSRPSPDVRSQEQMEDLVVKLHDIGRELMGKLDTKIRILNRLIEEADEKISKLGALGVVEGFPETKSRPAPEMKTAADAFADMSAPPQADSGNIKEKGRYTAVYTLADAGRSIVEIARQTGMQPGEIELVLELRKNKNRDTK